MADTDAIDARQSQTLLENLLRDTILQALGVRLAPVATIAALRLVGTQGATGTIRNDDHVICVGTGPYVAFRWSQVSTATDDGVSVVKPADVSANGRWIAWTSPLRFSTTVGANSVTLDQVATGGPLARVIVLDKNLSTEEINALLVGAVPAVIIEADGDDPVDLSMPVGNRWDTAFHFKVTALTENLRDRREAAQGSSVPGESTYGANTIDGLVKVLLSGTQLAAALPGVREVVLGHGENWSSELGQRRVMRSRSYTVVATEQFPNAPNEVVAFTDVEPQAHLVQPDAAGDPIDENNVLLSGCVVATGSSLTQAVSAGMARVGGTPVTYAGQSFTFSPYTDTYRDLDSGGTMHFTAVTEGGAAPALTAGQLRVGVTKAYASAVVSDRVLCAIDALYGPRYDIPV